jgi:hypothetical protein
LAGILEDIFTSGGGTTAAFVFAGSVFAGLFEVALLEMTKGRRTGAGLALAGLAGLTVRWLLRDALFGVVTLRFNINYLTLKYCLSSEK